MLIEIAKAKRITLIILKYKRTVSDNIDSCTDFAFIQTTFHFHIDFMKMQLKIEL